MGNLFELVDKKCPECGKDTLVLGMLTNGKIFGGMTQDIHTINIYCSNGNCIYNKDVAKRRD